jgi:antitoxin Phd
MKTWQLQEAKARFSEVIKDALTKGPQEITLRKEPTVMLISIKDYLKLKKPKASLVDFLAQSPFKDADVEFTRDKSLTRMLSSF